ncbi:MAG TPA: hypothetical protein VLW84_12380 [Terriglobales bacterium]|nr:hypothetical protein [Terriglobales bacterium]
MGKRFSYQQQACALSLREGLAEYYSGHPGLLKGEELEGDSRTFFRSHDACHVVFGLDTNLQDEALADFWAMMGTDVGLRRYVDYLRRSKETMQIFREIGWGKTVLTTIRAIPKTAVVFLHTRKMTKKWPWTGYETYMDTALNKIRAEFGVVVL